MTVEIFIANVAAGVIASLIYASVARLSRRHDR